MKCQTGLLGDTLAYLKPDCFVSLFLYSYDAVHIVFITNLI